MTQTQAPESSGLCHTRVARQGPNLSALSPFRQRALLNTLPRSSRVRGRARPRAQSVLSRGRDCAGRPVRAVGGRHPRTYVTGEVVVIGDGEICQVPQAHLPAPDSVHDENV